MMLTVAVTEDLLYYVPNTFTPNGDGTNDIFLPVLTAGFSMGGLFSSTSGLVINGSTGEINISRSIPGNYIVNYSVQANPSTCALAGTSNFTVSISNPFAVTIDDNCQDQMLFLEALPVNNSFNPLTVNYVWRDYTNNIIGSNSSTLNVDDYLLQHQSLSFPLNFNVSVTLNGCDSVANFTVENNPCKLIPRGFSPNNDDFNDTFNLTGMGVTELIIFNRFGTKVYSFNGNYSNQWNGASNSGQDLPDATYFYTIKKGNGETITGWVYINR